MIAVLIVSIICASITCICYAFAIYGNYKSDKKGDNK